MIFFLILRVKQSFKVKFINV